MSPEIKKNQELFKIIEQYIELVGVFTGSANPSQKSVHKANYELEKISSEASGPFNDAFRIIKKINSGNNIYELNLFKLFYKLAYYILTREGFSKGLVHFHSIDITSTFLKISGQETNYKFNFGNSNFSLEDNLEQIRIELSESLINIISDIENDFDKTIAFIERIEKTNNVSAKVQNFLSSDKKVKKRTILDEKREAYEISNDPEYIKALYEQADSQFKKLTDKDIQIVTEDCNVLNEVFLKGLSLFERFFDTNNLSNEDIDYIKTNPFRGLLSDNYFQCTVLENFNDEILGFIIENCFGETIKQARETKLYISISDEIKDKIGLKELIRIILKTNIHPILVKDNLISLSKEIHELIELVYSYNKESIYITEEERQYFEEKMNRLPNWLANDDATILMPVKSSIPLLEIQSNENQRNLPTKLDSFIETDINTRKNYENMGINEFCDFLIGKGDPNFFILDDADSFPKSKMFDYIKTNTDNFNANKFNYFIEDLRDYVHIITFHLKKNDNHTIECDNITGEKMKFMANGLPVKDYHFSDHNDFTKEQIENSQFFGKIKFTPFQTLIQRFEIIEKTVPNVSYGFSRKKIVQFSQIAEYEYQKINDSLKTKTANDSEVIPMRSKEVNLNLEQFLTLYQSDIETDIRNNNATTNFTTESFIKEITNVVEQLKPLRLDDWKTSSFISDYVNKYSSKKTDEGGNEIYLRDSTNYFLLRNWLYSIFDRNNSFYYARVILLQFFYFDKKGDNKTFPTADPSLFLNIEAAVLKDMEEERKHNIQSTLTPENLINTTIHEDFNELTDSINNAFFRLECFMNGTLSNYKYFGFNNVFSKLFIEANTTENFTVENTNLISQYWSLCSQISNDFDKGDFDNQTAFQNDDFCKDCNELENLYWERIKEFECFFPPSSLLFPERKISITDILNNNVYPQETIGKMVRQNKELTLSDFLINKSDLDKFISIQNNFKKYEGKRLAILIHLLQNEYRILKIISKSRTHSRKHFIRLFKENNSFDKTFAINKYINPFTNELNLTTALDFDADYVDVKEKLTKVIENPVV